MRAWACFSGLVIVLAATGCGDDDGTGDGGPADTGPGEAICGNGIVEEGEDCDQGTDGNIDGTGCDSDCTYSCTSDADCDDGNECNGEEQCSASLHRCQAGTPLADGTACTVMAPAPSEDDGGISEGPDGGFVEPELVETPSVCIQQQCALPCEIDDECSDGNPCNGEETCNSEYDACEPGEPPDCDDDLECTINECDPEENPETGCIDILIDEDGDGYAPEHLECDERGGDCDDDNPDVHPGAERICGDGIDNNCIGTADDTEVPIWYQDCDGDGYAASGATLLESCTKPSTTSECVDWTQRTPSGASNIDCDDSNAAVYPGATSSTNAGYYDRPHCRGTGELATGSAGSFSCSSGTLSWDYNCNGLWDRRWTNTNHGSLNCSTLIIAISDTPDSATEGEQTSTPEATHKASLMDEVEPTGGFTFCTCSTTRGAWLGDTAPSCGTIDWRLRCNGCDRDGNCRSAWEQQMQQCR
jgi:hypothetical protein